MGYLAKARQIISEQENRTSVIGKTENIGLLTLMEFSKRNLAIPIYSKLLDQKIWLCSNDNLAKKILADIPEAVTYTASELRQLYKLDNPKEMLKQINTAKSVLKGSKLIFTENKPINE